MNSTAPAPADADSTDIMTSNNRYQRTEACLARVANIGIVTFLAGFALVMSSAEDMESWPALLGAVICISSVTIGFVSVAIQFFLNVFQLIGMWRHRNDEFAAEFQSAKAFLRNPNPLALFHYSKELPTKQENTTGPERERSVGK